MGHQEPAATPLSFLELVTELAKILNCLRMAGLPHNFLKLLL
jgi:hypothetical protein